MRKLACFIAVLLFSSASLFAQNRTVTGKVTDDKDGTALPGVSIVVKGTSVGTTSGADGSYSISVPASGRVLVFTFVNFQSVEQVIGTRATVNVALTSTEKSLQEVVVTGYSREKKSQYAGAATTLGSGKFTNVPVTTFDQALQGNVAGLLLNSGSGQPGTSGNITIRGISSISGANVQPLFVVDGVPMPAFDFAAVNPNDFESVTVLKDAAAGALYGSRGAYGVIVITTKRGKAGQANFTYRAQYGFTQAPNPNKFDMMTSAETLQYEEMMGLIVGNAMSSPGWAYSKKNPSYALQTPTEQARRDRLLDSFRNNNVDFYKLLFRQGTSQTHEINMSGGNTATKYFMSLNLFDQKGVDLKSRLRRYTARFNLDNTIGKLNLQFNSLIGFANTDINEGSWYGNSPRNPFQIVWRAKPYENPLRADGTPIFGAATNVVPRAIGNAIEGNNNSGWTDKQIKVNSGLVLGYKILPDLLLKNTTGIDVASEFAQRYIDANSYVGSLQTYQSGYNAETFRIRTQLINTTGLIYNKKLERHDFEVGAYFEVNRIFQKGLGFVLFNLDPRLEQTGQGAGALPTGGAATMPQNASSAKSGFGIRSYFTSGRYTYNNKYTLTASIRRDGTSRILKDENKEITGWAAGVSWDAIKEDFFTNVKFLSDLKVRANYGKVPNINSIPGGAAYGISGGGIYGISNYLGAQVPSFATTTGFAGSTITGLIPRAYNGNLRMEYVNKLNFGIEAAMFRNRIRLVVDLYNNVTNDLFVSQPLPAPSGFGGSSLDINAGSMRNRGIEVTLSGDVVKTKNFDFTISMNHSINENEIVDLGAVSEYPVGTFIIKEGLPYGSHYTQWYLGADPATGAPLYRTKDGKTTSNFAAADLFHEFGTYLPKHVGGVTFDFRYKKFTVTALFSYQFDVTRYNNVENWTTRGTPGYLNAVNANRKMLTEQWMKPGDVKYYQSPAFDRQFTSSDVHDAKFLRFRNLNVGYTLPQLGTAETRFIKSARIYFQGQNLFIWSPWRGLDPEDNNNISLQEFPNPRAVVVGIDINF